MYRESDNVSVVLSTIESCLQSCTESYELIVIDDGSPDTTWEMICRYSARHKTVRGIRLSRNFGKEHALSAGLNVAQGAAAVVMDGDLQHPPELIPKMLDSWRRAEADIVEAIKSHRGSEPYLSRLFATAFYRILRNLSGFDLENASDFKLLDRRVVEAWRRLPERNLFFRGMTAWLGFRRVQIPFEVAERVGGRSRWSLFSLFRLALTAFTAFSSAFLQLVTVCGVAFLVFSFLWGLFTIYVWYRQRAAEGFSTVILLQLFIGSLIMISLGIIGLYLARIYDEVKRRPRYLVAETIGITLEVDTHVRHPGAIEDHTFAGMEGRA
jgi:glycosyltransferase involved in cell wall biosynthesis